MARDTNITVRLRDRFSQGMSRLGRGVRGLRQRFFNLRTAIVGVVAALGAFSAARGVANFLKGAVNTAKDFQSQMSTVRAVTGATAEEFSALNTAAEEAGRSTRFTATEAGQGLENLSRAGFSAKQAIDALNPTLNLAQANGIAVAEAASLITTTLNQYGQSADQAGRASDIFTRAAQRADTTVTDLGEAFGYVGPLAAQAGVNIEDTAAMLASLADQGFRGSRAGTALTRMFIELQNPSSKFRQELGKIGITTTDAIEVIEQLGAKGDDARDALLALGQRGGPAIAALVNEGIPKLKDLRGELRESEGTAKDAAETMDDNLGGALKNLGSAFEGLQIKLVSELMADLKDEVFGLADRIRNFTESESFDRLTTKLAQAFRDGAAAVKQFIADFDADAMVGKIERIIGKTGEFVTSTLEFFGSIQRVATVVSSSLAVVRESLNFTSAATERFGAAVRVMLLKLEQMTSINPFRDYEAQIEAATERVEELDAKAEEHHGKLQDALARLKTAWNDEGDAAADAGDKTEAAGEAADSSANFFDRLTGSIQNTFQAAKELVSGEGLLSVTKHLDEARAKAAAAADAQGDVADQLRRQNPTLRDTGNEIQNVSDQTETWNKVTKSWEEATKKAGDETEEAAGKSKDLGEQSEKTAEQVESGTESFEEAAAGARGVGQAIADIAARYKELGGNIGELGQDLIKEAGRMPDTILSFFRNLGRDLGRAEEEFERNVEVFERWRAKLEAGEATAGEFANAINQIGGEAALLDKQRLDFFRQQLQQARQDAAALRREIAETTADIEAELLRAQGKESELIERRFANRRRELELLLESTTDQAQKTKLREALRNLEELEEIELRKIRERNEAERAANQETHRQREADATDFHEGELGRADERAQANAGAVANFNQAEAEAEARHERELQRIEERKETEVRALDEIREARERALGGAQGAAKGAMGVGAGGPGGRMQIDLRVLSDALNGQGLTIGPQALEQLTEGIVRRLLVGASTSGTRRVN